MQVPSSPRYHEYNYSGADKLITNLPDCEGSLAPSGSPGGESPTPSPNTAAPSPAPSPAVSLEAISPVPSPPEVSPAPSPSTQPAPSSPGMMPQPPSGQNQTEQLLALKASFTNGDVVLADWNATEGDPCTNFWTGVTCDGDLVAEM